MIVHPVLNGSSPACIAATWMPMPKHPIISVIACANHLTAGGISGGLVTVQRLLRFFVRHGAHSIDFDFSVGRLSTRCFAAALGCGA